MTEMVFELRSTKFNGAHHRISTFVELGTDEFGLWGRSTDSSRIDWGNGEVSGFAFPTQIVVPFNGSGWTISFISKPGGVEEVYGNICLPPKLLVDGTVEAVDLDLDVVGTLGSVSIVDWDEFEENRVLMAYPPGVEEFAQRQADGLQVLLGAGSDSRLARAEAEWRRRETYGSSTRKR
jgi:protein associated with RNAse G/E